MNRHGRQLRKYENRERMQIQQPVFIYGNQFRWHSECGRISKFELMTWPNRPYVSSWTGPANGDWQHLEAPIEDGLLRALLLQETNSKSGLSPLRDGTRTPRTGPHRYMWVDARKITRMLPVLHHICR